MASASDIPHKFDLLVNGEGYVLADAEQQKAVLGYTSPFIPRTSVQTGSSGQPGYGDSDTEFFQTFTQKDWSKGEGQRYQGDEDEARSRFWKNANSSPLDAGRVTIHRETATSTAAANPTAGITRDDTSIYFTTSTNLYSIVSSGAITDHGAHGSAPLRNGLAVDGDALYMTDGGTVRKWDGAAFSNFSTTDVDAIAYLNNALYGYHDGALIRFDTAGATTTLFTWQGADGGALLYEAILCPYGGKLLILIKNTQLGPELWLYDGTAPAVINRWTPSFIASDICVTNGVVFVAGLAGDARNTYRPAVDFYANGQVGVLWLSDDTTDSTSKAPDLAEFNKGLAINDWSGNRLLFYSPENGGVHSLTDHGDVSATTSHRLASCRAFTLQMRSNSTTLRRFPTGTTVASSGTITTSLIDFDSSLTKAFRGITVEWDDDATDTGATVDISYRVGDVDGSYTSLQVGAVSGTEYTLSGVTGKSISVRVTLNKTNSTLGPTLKRIRVRAVPMRQPFRKDQAILNLQGRDGNNIRLRDGATHTKDGKSMATDLRTAATSAAPITIIDTFGSYTGIIESLELIEVRPEEFLARINFREV